MATIQRSRPAWYTADDETAWGKVKAAFRRDWQQTKHDFGGHEPNLNQQVGDTVSQATGAKPIPAGNVPTPHPSHSGSDTYNDKDEPAYQYGYAAYRHFGNEHGDQTEANWDEQTEAELRREWGDETEWERQREAVRRGWTFGKMQGRGNRPK